MNDEKEVRNEKSYLKKKCEIILSKINPLKIYNKTLMIIFNCDWIWRTFLFEKLLLKKNG